jgi:hypothetical protein
MEGDGVEIGSETVLRWLHERAVEGRAYREHDSTLCSHFFAKLGGAFDGLFGTADDDLSRRVDVGGLADLSGMPGNGLGAGFANLLDAERENGGHGTDAYGNSLLHVLAAIAHSANGIGKAYGSGGDVGGVFAERVAGNETGTNSGFGENAGGSDGDGEYGGLRNFGEAELLVGAFKAKLAEAVAERGVRFFKGAAGDDVIGGKFLAHPGGL